MLSDDLLPQPYRLVNKILQGILANSLDEIGRRLQQGCVVDKQFAPPRTLPTINLHMQRIATTTTSTASTAATCCQLGSVESIFGLPDGRIKIVASDGDEPEFISEPLVGDVPVVAVASSRPLYHEPIYAAASESKVAVVAVDIHDATPPPSAVPVAGFGGVALRNICLVTSELLDGKKVSSLQLALDGRTLAVGVDSDALVYVFDLPQPPPQSAAAPAAGDGTANAADAPPCPERVLVATPPPNMSTSSPDVVARAVFNFFCRNDNEGGGGALGYYHEQRALRPLRATSLMVAWCGTNAVSRFPLGEFYEGISERIADAKACLADAANQAQQAAAAAAALASNAAGAKGGKGDKGAKPSASPSGGTADGGGAAGAAGAAAVALYPESFFSGRRDVQLPRTIVTAAFDNERSLCAIGCFDGIVAVHDGHSVRTLYAAAPHRLQQQTINNMYPASMHFLPCTRQLIVAFVVQRLPYRCFVDTYDLGVTVTNGALSAFASSGGGADAGPQTHLPRGCLSRMKYLHRLRAVVPIGGLPFVLLLVEGGTFVLDVTSGDVVARAQLDDGAVPDVLDVLPDAAFEPTTTVAAAMAHAAKAASLCYVPTVDAALVVHSGTLDTFRIDAAAVASELYPALAPLLAGSYGRMTMSLFNAMLRFCCEVPHSKRGQSTHLVTSFLSVTQQLTELSSMQVPAQGNTSAGGVGGGSVASTMKGKHQQQLSDGRQSHNSMAPSRKGGSHPTTAQASATPGAAACAGTMPTHLQAAQYQLKPSGALGSAWEFEVRGHIEHREDTRHLRKERLNNFWEAMKKR